MNDSHQMTFVLAQSVELLSGILEAGVRTPVAAQSIFSQGLVAGSGQSDELGKILVRRKKLEQQRATYTHKILLSDLSRA